MDLALNNKDLYAIKPNQPTNQPTNLSCIRVSINVWLHLLDSSKTLEVGESLRCNG